MKKPELPALPPPAPAAVRPVKPPKPAPPPPPLPEDDLLCDPAPVTVEPIIGSGDRAHHLALVAGHGTVALRPVPQQKDKPGAALPPLRPSSRLACERRCGRAGQCDPASPFGCGGEYCRGFEGRLY